MKIRGLIFDFDGVVVDSEPFWEKADSRLMAGEGKRLIPEAKKAVIGLKQSDSIRIILKMHGIGGDPEAFMKKRERMMEEYYTREIPLNPGACEAIGALHESGIKMIVASSTPKRLVELCLRRFGMLGCFIRVVSGDEVERGKPAPDIFLLALGSLGLPADDVAVVEDAVPGLLGARAAGLKAIWYRNDHQPEGEKIADATIDGLSELKTLIS